MTRPNDGIRQIASAIINAGTPRLKAGIRGEQIDEDELAAEIEDRLQANGMIDKSEDEDTSDS